MTTPSTRPAAVIVLAAGAGTRMKSRTPKIMHSIGGVSMIGHALNAARGLDPEQLVAVVRHQREKVAEHITGFAEDHDFQVTLADQDDVPGTGRAVECGLEALTAAGTPAEYGTVVVTYGDVPLLTTELLHELVSTHEDQGNAVTVLTALLEDASGYGRILRDEDGSVTGIVEQKDATEQQREIREINSGIYAFDAAVLTRALAQVTPRTTPRARST